MEENNLQVQISTPVHGASRDARRVKEQKAHDGALAGLRRAFAQDELERRFAEGAVPGDEEAARTAIDGSEA